MKFLEDIYTKTKKKYEGTHKIKKVIGERRHLIKVMESKRGNNDEILSITQEFDPDYKSPRNSLEMITTRQGNSTKDVPKIIK